MRANLDATHGLIVSEAVMMGLAPKLGRDKAHDVLYAICHDPAIGDRSLRDLLLAHPEVAESLGEDEIGKLTDPANYLGLSETMVDRVLAKAWGSALLPFCGYREAANDRQREGLPSRDAL